MSEFGFMGVDWEERIDFGRMRRERLQRAKDAMEKAGADLLFIFALEDVRYLHRLPVLPRPGGPPGYGRSGFAQERGAAAWHP